MNLAIFEVTTVCFVLIGGVNAQFTQKMWEVARSDRIKVLSCDVDGSAPLSSTVIHWYRAKPGEGLHRIMHFPAGAKSATKNEGLSKGLSGSIKGQKVSLTISKVTREDAATYFCALWKGVEKVFSSGTKLYVTDGGSSLAKEPKVSPYLTTKQDNGKAILLCQARDMFPDMVKITWMAKHQNGAVVTIPETDDELLEQRDEGQDVRVTSILITSQQKASSSTFTCIVHHDSLKKDKNWTFQIDEEELQVKLEVTPNPGLVQTCAKVQKEGQGAAETEGEGEGEHKGNTFFSGSSGLTQSLHLFRLTYVLLVLKNVLYFCSVSVLLYKRKLWNKEPLISKT